MKLKRGHLNNQGKFVSFKMQKTVIWKSLLEFDYVHLLEIDSEVQHYTNCDFKLEFSYAGQKHSVAPNFIIEREQKSYLIYLLHNRQNTEDHISKLKHLALLCREKGYVLQIVTEEEIRRQPRLSNAKIILKYATKTLDDPLPRLLCYRLFISKKILLLEDVVAFFIHNSATKRDVFRLIYHGILSIDITKSLDESTFVTFVG